MYRVPFLKVDTKRVSISVLRLAQLIVLTQILELVLFFSTRKISLSKHRGFIFNIKQSWYLRERYIKLQKKAFDVLICSSKQEMDQAKR